MLGTTNHNTRNPLLPTDIQTGVIQFISGDLYYQVIFVPSEVTSESSKIMITWMYTLSRLENDRSVPSANTSNKCWKTHSLCIHLRIIFRMWRKHTSCTCDWQRWLLDVLTSQSFTWRDNVYMTLPEGLWKYVQTLSTRAFYSKIACLLVYFWVAIPTSSHHYKM